MPIREYGYPIKETVIKESSYDLKDLLTSIATGLEIGEKVRKKRLEEQALAKDELTRLSLKGFSLKDILATEEGKKLYAKAFGINSKVFSELYDKYGERVLPLVERGEISMPVDVVSRTGGLIAGVKVEGLRPEEQRLGYLLSLGQSLTTTLPYYPEVKIPTDILREPSLVGRYIGTTPAEQVSELYGFPSVGVVRPTDIVRAQQLEFLKEIERTKIIDIDDDFIVNTISGIMNPEVRSIALGVLNSFRGTSIRQELVREIIDNIFTIDKEFASLRAGAGKSLLDTLLRKVLEVAESYSSLQPKKEAIIKDLIEKYKKITGGDYKLLDKSSGGSLSIKGTVDSKSITEDLTDKERKLFDTILKKINEQQNR